MRLLLIAALTSLATAQPDRQLSESGSGSGQTICDYVVGDGVGVDGSETMIGTYPTREACALAVGTLYSNASGATYTNNNQTSDNCFAEFGMTTVQPDGSWQACLFGGWPAAGPWGDSTCDTAKCTSWSNDCIAVGWLGEEKTCSGGATVTSIPGADGSYYICCGGSSATCPNAIRDYPYTDPSNCNDNNGCEMYRSEICDGGPCQEFYHNRDGRTNGWCNDSGIGAILGGVIPGSIIAVILICSGCNKMMQKGSQTPPDTTVATASTTSALPVANAVPMATATAVPVAMATAMA